MRYLLLIPALALLAACGSSGGGSSAIPQTNFTPLQANLAVTNFITTPANPTAGQAFTFTANVVNNGSIESSATTLNFQIWNGSAWVTARSTAIPSMLAGGSTPASVSDSALAAGTYYFQMVVDPSETVSESSYSDNTQTLTVVVAPASSG